jgi:hypothetical protein
MTRFPDTNTNADFSPVENEPPLRLQRVVRLAPAHGLGVGRRAVFFALLAWLPIATWALLTGRFFEASAGEPLLQHYGVHVRCLLVIPMLIVGEATLHAAATGLLPQFVRSGLVDDASGPGFDAVLRGMRLWRDRTLPWVFVAGFALAWSVADRPAADAHDLAWARELDGAMGFGGVWLAYVVRPIVIALLLGWLWRIVLLVVLFAKIGRLGLAIVPTHPDRTGGLGFLERVPCGFAPVTFAVSAMLASRWTHDLVYHGQSLQALKWPAATFAVAWSLLLLAPSFAMAPALLRARREALPGYAALVAHQGRLVHREWIVGDRSAGAAGQPAIEPAGVGPIADAAAMYEIVRSMRPLPIGMATLACIAVPILVPFLVVVAVRIPLRELMTMIVKAVM